MLPQVPPTARLRFDRRRFLATAAGLVAAGALPRAVLAYAAPRAVAVGDVALTLVSDGELWLPASILAPAAEPEALAALIATLAQSEGNVELAALPVLIRDGGDLVLMDMGSGKGYAPTAGRLTDGLAAAGVDPAAITRVIFTHAHPDHLFGVAGAEGLVLPNAAYAIGRAEWEFWMAPAIFDIMPSEMHQMVGAIQASLAAIEPAVTLLEDGDRVTANVVALATPGHTPGHLAFEVTAAEGAILVGDSIPSNLVQFPHPDWAMAFDAVPDLANATRRALLNRAAAERKLLIGYHWADPVGYAEAAGDGFAFVPA